MWINSSPVDEIGARVMLAGAFGIPTITLAGDRTTCRQIH